MTSPTPSLLHNRSVMAVWGVMFTSAVGLFIQATALGKLVYDISGRELDLGLLGLAEFAPAALLVLVTGAVADRFDRRYIASLGLVGEVGCAVAIAVYASSSPTAVGPIFAISFVFGIFRAFVAPAARSLPANVAPPGLLPKVTATNSAMWQSALIVGPIISGFLYAGSPVWPFAVAAVLGGLAAIIVLFVRLLPQPARAVDPESVDAVESGGAKSTMHGALDGLKFIKATPILLAAISLDLFAVLFGGAVALLPAIAEEQLHVGAVGLGWLRSAAGVGAVVMAVGLARKPIVRHIGRTLLIAVGIFGAATIALGLTHSYLIAFVAIAILSAADMVSVFVRSTLVPLATPDEVRGRVLAAENVFIGASNELGAFESGVAGQVLGTTGAVVSGGVLTLGVAVLWWFRFPVLRRLDRFTDLVPEEEVGPAPPAEEAAPVDASAAAGDVEERARHV